MNIPDTSSINAPLRFAQYLKEFVGLRTTTVRDVAKYETVLWFSDMLQEKDCFSPAWVDACEPGDPWLVVKKQQYESMPDAPKNILPWIDSSGLAHANGKMPELKKRILESDDNAELHDGESAPSIELQLGDNPEVQSSYDSYHKHWQAWADEHMRRQKIQDLYARLFGLHTQLRKQGELLELVLGLGLLDWRAHVGGHVRRHLITAQVELIFEPEKGVIRLAPPGDGARLRIEDDMLEAELRPGRAEYQAVQMQLDNIGDEIWDQSLMHNALKHWAGALSADSLWSADLRSQASDPKKPVVSFAPALILRKRTQAGMVRIYNSIIDQLADGSAEVPEGWAGLIDDIEDNGTSARTDDGNPRPTPEVKSHQEIYFPLPANKEQRRIVEAIDHQRGVLVQGPPGTGKSHTIANLICHLLATGKRVLITAETSRALMVLKDKLPEEIQPLCVSLLGQGGDAFAELNMAVSGITNRQASYMPGAYEPRIAEIDIELDSARRKLAETDNEIRSLREEETCPHQIANGNYAGTASVIAKRVAAECAEYGWLKLPYDAPVQPLCSNEEMVQWLEICSLYSVEDIAESKLKLPFTKSLVTPQEFSVLVEHESVVKEAFAKIEAARSHPAYGSLSTLTTEQRVSLGAALRKLEEKRFTVMRINNDWYVSALRDLLSSKRARWNALLIRNNELLSEAHKLSQSIGNSSVSLPEKYNLQKMRSDAQTASQFLSEGGSWKRMGLFTPTILKDKTYLKNEILVDGLSPASHEQLDIVCDELSLILVLEEIISVWLEVGVKVSTSNRLILLAELKEQQADLQLCFSYADACLEINHTFTTYSPPVAGPNWLNDKINNWVELLDVAEKEEIYKLASEAVNRCADALKRVVDLHDVHPNIPNMVAALEQRDVNNYSKLYADIIELEKVRAAQLFRADIENRIKPDAPYLLDDVVENLSETDWQSRFTSWTAAWYWSVADNWFTKRADVSYQQELFRKRHDIESKINKLIAESAGLRAWTHFFKRLSTRESAALKSWREAVKSMGKGTGKSAKMSRLREEARQYMDQCRDAIPIWVMPRYLVAEMMDPAPGRYDIVIVDEASQLGIESLFLFYIAKKMVVVGDDQQISPYGIGIADEDVAGLQQHYLEGIPHRHALSPQSSLYGNAKIRFSQNVVLREHFRCMPEIIQFSNDLCYASNGTPLDPLRAYPANRLQPLVLRHIADGYRTGGSQHAQNIPEADAIVAQIVGCIADPRYKGKTMGVISLQGDTQAKLIEKKLLETLEPEVIDERELICGDAYAFQGDERHIIFLSMVAAPGETRMSAMTNDSARQRFNVAVSRAQDQLWLFHTATLDVLSPLCMRYRLLKYMQEPKRVTSVEDEQQFDSEFERAVYKQLTARGFHVRTQVSIGDPTNHKYRLDLVVEGMQGRLVVECDGDQWHGPERYEYDMARQRDLERSGWQFARVRGSDFYRDQEAAMLPVWSELDRLGINPGGVDSAAELPPAPVNISGNVNFFDSDDSNEPESSINIVGDPISQELQMAEEETEASVSESTHQPQLDLGADKGGEVEKVEITSLIEVFQEVRKKPEALQIDTAETEARCLETDDSAYIEFEGLINADPRNPGVGVEEIADELMLIIKTEAPMLAKRAYDIYLRRCGIQRMGGELRKTLNKSLQHLIIKGYVVSEDELDKGGLLYTIVRLKGTAPVVVRKRGSRDFSEIPPSELLTVAKKLAAVNGFAEGTDEHFRAILEHYDLTRLTTQVSATLLEVLNREYTYV